MLRSSGWRRYAMVITPYSLRADCSYISGFSRHVSTGFSPPYRTRNVIISAAWLRVAGVDNNRSIDRNDNNEKKNKSDNNKKINHS